MFNITGNTGAQEFILSQQHLIFFYAYKFTYHDILKVISQKLSVDHSSLNKLVLSGSHVCVKL